MGHFHKLLCEEMIFPLHKGKNDGLRYEVIIFSRAGFSFNLSFLYTKVCGNSHSHNKGFLMQKYPFIQARDFSFILCKYLIFFFFVENLRTSLRKIYGHGPPYKIFVENLRTNKWKILRGNKWIFLHQKILHFNGNGYLFTI